MLNGHFYERLGSLNCWRILMLEPCSAQLVDERSCCFGRAEVDNKISEIEICIQQDFRYFTRSDKTIQYSWPFSYYFRAGSLFGIFLGNQGLICQKVGMGFRENLFIENFASFYFTLSFSRKCPKLKELLTGWIMGCYLLLGAWKWYLHEYGSELVSKQAVDEEVDGWVDSDEEVCDSQKPVWNVGKRKSTHSLHDVVDQGKRVANEKHQNNHQKHGRQIVLLKIREYDVLYLENGSQEHFIPCRYLFFFRNSRKIRLALPT